MTRHLLPLVVVLGWSVPAFAQPAQESPAASADRFRIACAPMSPTVRPGQAIRVLGSYQHGRLLFGPDEPLIVNAGANQGLKAGQQYYVRRVVHDRFTQWTLGYEPISVHTSGWVRIVEVQPDTAVATVTQACDGVIYGDYLEPFTEPVVPADAGVAGEADFAHPAHITMGDEKQQTGAAGSLMVVDQGADQGIRPGQMLTIYRPTSSEPDYMMDYGPTLQGRGPSMRVGTARVLVVQPNRAVVRIESSREAIYIGDFAAVHRTTP
jgi:hypothetical protein